MGKYFSYTFFWCACIAACMLALFLIIRPVNAGILDDLKKSIEEKNIEIQKLEEDAKKYRAELATKQQMGKNLKQELGRIAANIKKLKNDVAITQQQITRAELQIIEISYQIDSKEQSIKKLTRGLASLVSVFYQTEQNIRHIFNSPTPPPLLFIDIYKRLPKSRG